MGPKLTETPKTKHRAAETTDFSNNGNPKMRTQKKPDRGRRSESLEQAVERDNFGKILIPPESDGDNSGN